MGNMNGVLPAQPGPYLPLVEVVRSGFVEGLHHGLVVVTDPAGRVLASAGDPRLPLLPRSTNKPFQAVAMLRAGLALTGPDLALAASSHSGEDRHADRVAALLACAGLDESALHCPADLPLDEATAHTLLAAGGGPRRSRMNCSGKHTAMLLTCQAAGWPLAGYWDPHHPLQLLIQATLEELASESVSAVAIDGCGAPVLGLTPLGLARAFQSLVESPAESPERRVADAMRAHPEMVGGEGREVTRLLREVPGLLVKDGAEGLYAAAMPGVGAVVVKIADGAVRARSVAMATALRLLLGDHPTLVDLAEQPLLGGGERVGTVRAVWPRESDDGHKTGLLAGACRS
jgi:L-asparaginase II